MIKFYWLSCNFCIDLVSNFLTKACLDLTKYHLPSIFGQFTTITVPRKWYSIPGNDIPSPEKTFHPLKEISIPNVSRDENFYPGIKFNFPGMKKSFSGMKIRGWKFLFWVYNLFSGDKIRGYCFIFRENLHFFGDEIIWINYRVLR